ncbi:hypothetical protein FOZ62_027803, partial [Perkinsus olseni]
GERVSKQTEALEWFKDTAEEASQPAVLIATSVCDEGVDVPICDCVVMWDVPPNVRSFIQRRGRARKIRPRKSELIVLVEASHDGVMKAEKALAEYKRQEAQMATLADCWEDVGSEDDDSDSGIDPRVVVGREGVRVSCRHAKGTLHEFASSLTATDEFFTPTPMFFGEKRDEQFRCTVLLPSSVHPPVARWAMSRWHATKARAIREASARQLGKLTMLPWVTPQFKNMYAAGKADGVREELLPPADLLELAAHELAERRADVAPAMVKPAEGVTVMYAYRLRPQWHQAGIEVPERLARWKELTRKRVSTLEKLCILTPGPLPDRVIEAVKEIPISASGLGRSDARLGTVKVTLSPEGVEGAADGAIGVNEELMDKLWAFYRQIFAKVDGGTVADDWRECSADRPFYMMVPAGDGGVVDMAHILDAFYDDPRLLVEIGLTVAELARVQASPLDQFLAAIPLHLVFEALTPKQCEMMIDSEKHEPLGCALLEMLASEYVWAEQFDEGDAALEGKLTEERQVYLVRDRVAHRGLLSAVSPAIQWRDKQFYSLPGYQRAEGAAQQAEVSERDRAMSFLNALRTSTTSVVGVVFGEAGWRAGMNLLRHLELINSDGVGQLVPHSAVGGQAEVEAMRLPLDIPVMVKNYLLRPPVTYDTLLVAGGLNVPPIGGYEFRRHPWLLMEAFTHASVAAVSPSYSNERLEWIGDAVLGAVVWSLLYEQGRATPSAFIDYTCNFHLSRVAVLQLEAHTRINVLSVPLQSAIGRYVRELYHDEQPVPKGPKALADCVEAVIGAIWSDAGGSAGDGWDAAEKFIKDNVFSLELADRRAMPRSDRKDGGPGSGPGGGRRKRRRRIPGLQADDTGGLGRSLSRLALAAQRNAQRARGSTGIINVILIFLKISRLSKYCHSLSFNMKLREYQTEVLDKIRQHRSTVAFMPTGSGKTLVAVRLLDERVEVQMHRQREGESRKACIFTAPNKVLCHQQAKYIEEHLRQKEPKILVLTGEVKETVAWEEKEWAAALRESSVVVCVPE